MFVQKLIVGAALAGAISLSGQAGGVVSLAEDISIGAGELQECTISKSMDADGDVDGRDLLLVAQQCGDRTGAGRGGCCLQQRTRSMVPNLVLHQQMATIHDLAVVLTVGTGTGNPACSCPCGVRCACAWTKSQTP